MAATLVATESQAQLGGKNHYEFLNLPASARITGLAGHIIAVQDEDISLAITNPASMTPKTSGRLSIAHNFHFADIGNGSVSYGHRFEKWNLNTHASLQYLTYGDFISSDNLGNTSGTFNGSEVAIVLGASRQIMDRLTVGANLKNVFSSYENYGSYGIGTDLAITYTNDTSRFTATLLIKNIGYEVSTYSLDRRGFPFDVQLGFSKKLKYLPLRYSIIGHQLHKADARYDDPDRKEEEDIFGQPIPENKLRNSIDNVFRHMLFNAELMLGKGQNLRLRMGYNHLRRRELSLSTYRSLAGFSLGFGIKAGAFKLDYGVGYYHLAGATNHITISTDLARLRGKK
jgi:hypothetical protein